MPGKKIFAIFDLDGTLSIVDTYPAFLIVALKRWPTRWPGAGLVALAAAAYWLGFKDNSWLKTVALRYVLSGKSRDQIESLANSFAKDIVDRKLRSAAATVLECHRHAGHQLVLATASFDFYVERIASLLDIENVICTSSSWSVSNRLVGELGSPNCYGKEKKDRVARFLGESKRDAQVVFYSDHHSDMPTLDFADLAIAVNPTTQLARIAELKNHQKQDWNGVYTAEIDFMKILQALEPGGEKQAPFP